MFKKLLELDKELFVYLNGLGSETFDGFWLFVTRQYNWIPLFALLLFLILRKLGTKQTLILILFVAALITISDQGANVFKSHFHRARPCMNTGLSACRVVEFRDSFSFFSAHASSSLGVALFLFLLMRRHYKYFWLLFLWPLIFAYSRIYLGLHYPSDIIAGYIFGATCGSLMFILYSWLKQKYFPVNPDLQHPADGKPVTNRQ